MTKHVKVTDIVDRISAVETELRSLCKASETAGEDDLTGERLEQWEALQTELADLKGKEVRAKQRDELDRKAPGNSVKEAGQDGTAWALTPEQRMADYVKATTGQSAEGLSVGRAVRAALTGNWKDAQGEHRAMGSGVNTTGGFFIPDPVSANVIDLARNASVLSNAGALTIPVTGNNMTIVRVVTDPTASWRGEGATIGESDASFDAILLVPSSLAALCRMNAELMDDAPNFAAQLDSQLAAALALKLDYAELFGSGSNAEPRGLRTATSVNESSMGTNGGTPADYDKFLDLIRDVELANGAPSTLIWSARTKNTLGKIVTGITSDKTKLAAPADFAALRKLVSNQVSVTETQGSNNASSTAFLGGFENMAIAVRQNLTIETSKVSGTAFEKNQIMVRAILRADIAIFRPAQFGRLIGITAS